MTYRIAVFKSLQGVLQWQIIATVDEKKVSFIDQQERLAGLPLLRNHETRIVNCIVKWEHSIDRPSAARVSTSDEKTKEIMYSYLMEPFCCRRGTVYPFIQQSQKGIRIVCYGTDCIHHTGTSFGTCPLDDISETTLKKEIGLAIQKVLKTRSVPDDVLTAIQKSKFVLHC
jgi:hypothetical protein